MKRLCLIFGDQLSLSLSSIKTIDKEKDVIFMCEVNEEATYVKHHKAKIAFIFSAMRHFALQLQKEGYRVIYSKRDDPSNQGSFTHELERIISIHSVNELVFTEPSEYRVMLMTQNWSEKFRVPTTILKDDRFLISPEEFKTWAGGKKQLLMEFFYRMMRQKYHILMKDGLPIGGKWNYDENNRQFPKKDLVIPKPFKAECDDITRDVIVLVNTLYGDHFGQLSPDTFYFAVTRQSALKALDDFLDNRLAQFGDYQDAMLDFEPWMFHSHISFYLNCGLLLPLECIQAAEEQYHLGNAPLNAVEGFIRQILGWREYVRGIYWTAMPEYTSLNSLDAQRALPKFFWDGETKMNCLNQCIKQTEALAYAHHIQRLMIIGNFSLITGLSPKEVNEWFLIVYADAFEWVELPNVTGMILYADNGFLGSKPYAAGGSYINKMSNYCKKCHYKIKQKTGKEACPFNYLYWHFLIRHESQFKSHHRMSMMYKTLDKMDPAVKTAIIESAENFLTGLEMTPAYD